MSARPKPSIRVAWDGEPEHPSYRPRGGDERSDSAEGVPVSAVASAAVVVVKNNTPAAVMDDESLEPLRPSYSPPVASRPPQPPPVRTERTQVGMSAVRLDDPPAKASAPPVSAPPAKASAPPVSAPPAKASAPPVSAPPAKVSAPPVSASKTRKSSTPPKPPSESYIPPAPSDPPRSKSSQPPPRARKGSDEFDFEGQVRAEGTLLSAQQSSDAPSIAPEPIESTFPDAIDDETELAQDVSDAPPAPDKKPSPPPAPNTKPRLSSVDGKAPPPVPSEAPRKKRPSQEPAEPAQASAQNDAASEAEGPRDLAAIPVISSDVVITDGAATVDAARAKKTARSSKPAWHDTFFDESYLRTYRVPPPDAVSRQCDFIETQLDLDEGASILDVGCGLGLQAKELSRRGYKVTGIDSSPTMLALAREADHGVEFLERDMRELQYDGDFDGAICWGTSFGYFDDALNKTVIEQLRNAVRPNGMLLVDVVNRDYVMRSQPNLIWFEGEGCVCLEESDFNAITSRLHVKRTTVLSDGRQIESPYSMRLYSVHELGQVLHTKGFRAKRVSGHPATPGVFFGSDSPRIIMAAERRLSSKMDRNTVSPSDVAKRRAGS